MITHLRVEMIILSANKSNDNRIACVELMSCIIYYSIEHGHESMIKHGAGGIVF